MSRPGKRWSRRPAQGRPAEPTEVRRPEPHESVPGIRHDLVARMRSAIAAGDYDTPDRLGAALERLFDCLGDD